MNHIDLYIANSPVVSKPKKVEGYYIYDGDEMLFKISNYDEMRPFFMTIVSQSDHWLFISSNGALSAGRKNASSALFPYYTDDKITDSAEITGSKTIVKILKDEKHFIWEPFSNRYMGLYSINRNLYKSRKGNKIIFEEINNDLEITYRYSWSFSNKYGFVKKSILSSHSKSELKVEILDGIQNILPYGVSEELQSSRSNLVDAYKKNELDNSSGLGIYSLSAMIVDKAEASETLAATTTWSVGLKAKLHLLSSLQLNNFRKGYVIHNETDIRAERGAYFINSEETLISNSKLTWYTVSEVNQSISSIIRLQTELKQKEGLIASLESDLKKGNDAFFHLVNMADGVQISQDRLINGRHFSNVLFNVMRGGLFLDQYKVEKSDLLDYLEKINRPVFTQNKEFLNSLPEELNYQDLLEKVNKHKDLDLERMCTEYLPLSFSRRHGDPSRPWNTFSIEINDPSGKKIKNYEGNWRDIFQNWEALAISFPEFIEGMTIKFLNASTIDGYNPYRITRDGIDWETVDENDPWSYIGYWGDHQTIYLLKLLELSSKYHPGKFSSLLNKKIGVYANVPYRINAYQEIIKNPSDTIVFDHELEEKIGNRVHQIGSDGKIILNHKEEILRATIAEKILITALTKLYNFIPEGGIWLNTQRPEWNDANNALVGNGTSMVTLYYLYRYLNFCIKLFGEKEEKEFEINESLKTLFIEMNKVYSRNIPLLNTTVSDADRKKMMDDLGNAGEAYRTKVYTELNPKTDSLKRSDIVAFFKTCNQFLAQSIKANKREDNLYHAYNLVDCNTGKIDHLYEMLEGQVAVLSSGLLTPAEALEVLEALKKSKMFRPDQYSYMLYPDRKLPKFLEKNTIPKEFSEQSSLLNKLYEAGDHSLVEKDINGDFHFNSRFHNADDVKAALDRLKKGKYSTSVDKEYTSILEVFEKIFNHKSFTGRSGTFYAFEGLGSIYWHMVSKLLLSVQENISKGVKENANSIVIGKLIEHYYEIRAGIGINKPPDLYGAFPTDAYSHTPGNRGAQQPGMTGQVKEDIINRWAELGVIIRDGNIQFKPSFLKNEEFLEKENEFRYVSIDNKVEKIPLPENSLAFTFCQTPIVYLMNDKNKIEVHLSNGSIQTIEGSELSSELSSSIFKRTQNVEKLFVYLKRTL